MTPIEFGAHELAEHVVVATATWYDKLPRKGLRARKLVEREVRSRAFSVLQSGIMCEDSPATPSGHSIRIGIRCGFTTAWLAAHPKDEAYLAEASVRYYAADNLAQCFLAAVATKNAQDLGPHLHKLCRR